MSDRIFAVLLLLGAVSYAIVAYSLEVPFQYEPLGPKPWPILIAVIVSIWAVIVLVRPDPEPHWPVGGTLVRHGVLLIGLALYAVLFEPLGFMLTTTVVCAVFALMLRAPMLWAGAFGLLMGVAGYYLWTELLQLNLPAGKIFG
jgi:putative tricarboxylic transport membrane protein